MEPFRQRGRLAWDPALWGWAWPIPNPGCTGTKTGRQETWALVIDSRRMAQRCHNAIRMTCITCMLTGRRPTTSPWAFCTQPTMPRRSASAPQGCAWGGSPSRQNGFLFALLLIAGGAFPMCLGHVSPNSLHRGAFRSRRQLTPPAAARIARYRLGWLGAAEGDAGAQVVIERQAVGYAHAVGGAS